MKDEVKKNLVDILSSINAIESFLGVEKTFESFKSNKMLRRAVEREFEIIGEATGRIKKHDTDFNLTHAKQIISLRNYIIHAYDSVDYEILWSIIINHLPLLKIEVQTFLK